jgi:hypothetical protein
VHKDACDRKKTLRIMRVSVPGIRTSPLIHPVISLAAGLAGSRPRAATHSYHAPAAKLLSGPGEEEFLAMGAQAAWMINPMNQAARQWNGTGWVEVARLEVARTQIYVELSYLWNKLDKAKNARRP